MKLNIKVQGPQNIWKFDEYGIYNGLKKIIRIFNRTE